MTDRIGSRLGPYQLVSLLGRGGMGEVYEARDTRLPRTVALKVLPLETSDDAQARGRFEREARAIASLHHHRICVVHDVGVDTGVYFIVMEYLDGETLAARLRRGALPFDELLLRAIEIVDGLGHAHRAGVVHRDVKPANIMLTGEGAKLLDFGLAALRPVVSDLASPATTLSLTQPGHVLGTLQYMAPEQLEGQEVDPRTDLFALGAVLYEMATGKKVFDAPSASGIIASILTVEPPSICAVEPSCSPALDWAIRRCLAKAPQARWQTAADLAAVLRWIQSTAGSTPQRPESSAPPPRARRRRWAVVSTMAAIGLLVGTWIVAPRWRTALPRVSRVPVRAAIPIDAGTLVGQDGLPALALSPDGTRIVYAAAGKTVTGLYLRRLDRQEATRLPGTDGASTPFFSPDGTAVGFFAAGKLKKVLLDGSSPPLTICDAPRGRGGSWVSPDTIVFAPSTDTGLFRVAAAGGRPEPLTTLSENPRERSHRWPELLPGGAALLFTTGNPSDTTLSDAQIVLQSLANPADRRVIVPDASHARYAAGHLLYLTRGSLVAAPFDPATLRITGSPIVVVEHLVRSSFVGAAQFTVSSEGSLVYLPDSGFQSQASLMWVNRSGIASPVGDVKRSFTAPRLSPDGTRIAVHVDDGDSDVWVYEPARGTLSRLTYRPEFEGNPVWTTDGARIVFASDRGPGLQLFWKRWDDPRDDEPLAHGSYARVPHSWSPDGSFLAFTENHPETRRDIWILPAGTGAKPYPFLVSPFEENQPSFSPDGKWLAYHSNESGFDEVYVRPFPGPGARLQVSSGGGSTPRWSKRGELFYRQGSAVAMVTITAGPDRLRVGPEKRLFGGDYLGGYDVSPDGLRFLMVRTDAARYPTHLILAQDWPGELGR